MELRCRADEAIALVERTAAAHAIKPGELTLGSDNGSAFTACRFRAALAELGLACQLGREQVRTLVVGGPDSSGRDADRAARVGGVPSGGYVLTFSYLEVRMMEVQFVASVAPIVRDPAAAHAFYGDALGLSFEGGEGGYKFTERLAGTKHFGLWPLAEAASACFGTSEWPDDVPVPQASIEFEVQDVSAAAEELTAKGYRLLHGTRTEPWHQITARLLGPEGLLVAVCYTPSFHDGPAS